jgi:hypothetical protein
MTILANDYYTEPLSDTDERYIKEPVALVFKGIIDKINANKDLVDSKKQVLAQYVYRDWYKQAKRVCGKTEGAADLGYSPHMTGRVFDLGINKGEIKDKAFLWFEKNAKAYGFINHNEIYGSDPDEPWHWEYRLTKDKLTEEEKKNMVCGESGSYTNIDPKVISGTTDETRVYDIKRTYKPEYIIVHHTAIYTYKDNASAEVEVLRKNSPGDKTEEVQKQYTDQGYVIDYNKVIDIKGNVAQGTPDKYWTINAGNNAVNFRSLSVSLIGNYDGEDKLVYGSETYNVLVKQIKEWMKEYEIKKENVLPHTKVLEKDDPDMADSEGTINTACPGQNTLSVWNKLIEDISK